MKSTNRKGLRARLYLVSAAILLLGLVGAAVIYAAAGNDVNDGTGYEIAGGIIYPNGFEKSKRYVHDLQLYGGQAAVLADDFMRWFYSLWHGRALAYTVACITAVLSFAIYVAANIAPSPAEPETATEDDRRGAAETLR